jgi:Bacterial Ig-like domain
MGSAAASACGGYIMAGPRRCRFAALVSVVAPAVLSAGLLVVSAAPAQAVEVLNQSPVPGEENAATDTNVRVTFDVAAMGVNTNTFTLSRLDGDPLPATVTGSGTTWMLNPNANLAPGTTFTARLSSGITDTSATPAALTPTSWDFTTGTGPSDTTAPTVTGRFPPDGEIAVATEVTVTARFSEEVQGVNGSTFTLERATTGVDVPAFVVRQGVSNRWILNPDDPLADGVRYIARLDGGTAAIRDLADNPLADTTWSFRTAGGVDTAGPRVVFRRPSPGATGVSRLTDVRVRFSETVRRVNDATFTLTNRRTGNEVAAVVSRLGASQQWMLEPDRALRRDTRYVVRLSGGGAGISDLDGNRLPFTTWGFRTGF